MSESDDTLAESERRAAAGRVATWFGGELGGLLQILRRTVAAAPLRASGASDQEAAARVLVAARACSTRAGTVLGLRAEPRLPVSSNLGRELATILAEQPRLRERGLLAEGFDSVDLPLSAPSLRTVLRELLGNACEASEGPPRVEATGSSATGSVELWVISRGTIAPPDATRAAFPFFTTKPGHRGLGLSAAHIAAENQGGRLEIVSAQGQTRVGVVFTGAPITAEASLVESNVTFACHLAAGLAHDVNNALMAALGWAEILGDARDEAERDEALATLSQAADYLEAMSYLLPHAAARPELGGALDLGQAIDRMRPLVRAVLEHKADRKIALYVSSVQGARVAMSEDALRALVLRLAENAREAMPRGGTWTIACDVEPRELLLTLSAEVRGSDRAPGAAINAAPGSSAKAHAPRQAALGLAVLRDLVQAAGGSFEDAPHGPPNPFVRIRLPGSPS